MLLRTNECTRIIKPVVSFTTLMTKNILAQIAGGIAACQMFVGKAFAQLPEPNTVPGLNPSTDIKQAIVDLLVAVLDFILIIAVVFVVVAGIRLIVSGGDEGEKDKAKQTIIYVIVGIIVVLFARVIVVFVNNLF